MRTTRIPRARLAVVVLATFLGGDASVWGQQATRVKVLGGDQATRMCEAVVVSDGALVHTGQVYPVGDDGKVVGTTAAEQSRAVLSRLKATLDAAGSQGLSGLVRITAYTATDEVTAELAKALPAMLPPDTVVSWMVMSGQVPAEPAGALLSVDAVATRSVEQIGGEVAHVGSQRGLPEPTKAGEFAAASILPPGDVIYISGQAEKGATLEEATEKTLAGLTKTLAWLGLSEADVVETRSFLQPADGDLTAVKEQFRKAFEGRPIPASTFLEWTAGNPSIEIEYVVSSRRVPWGERIKTLAPEVAEKLDAHETLVFLTPPWMTASPVYCRVAQVRRGNLVYFGSVTGDPTAEGGEIRDLFRRLDRTAQAAGCDLRHLAKATYFVSNPELVPQMGKIRPEFYDPKRPPAASMAGVRGVAAAMGRGIRIDMIGGEARTAGNGT